MKEDSKKNYLLKIKNELKNIVKEAEALSMPSILQTFIRTVVILVICGLLSLFFIFIGEVIVSLLRLII